MIWNLLIHHSVGGSRRPSGLNHAATNSFAAIAKIMLLTPIECKSLRCIPAVERKMRPSWESSTRPDKVRQKKTELTPGSLATVLKLGRKSPAIKSRCPNENTQD